MLVATIFSRRVCKASDGFGLAVTDITTGEFRFTQVAEEQSLFDEIGRIQPSELLLARARCATCASVLQGISLGPFHRRSRMTFSDAARRRIDAEQLRRTRKLAGGAAGGIGNCRPIWKQIRADSLKLLARVGTLRGLSNYLVLDETTRINLELIATYPATAKARC